MSTKLHAPAQIAMQLAGPSLPPMESYLAVMYAARTIGRRPAELQQHLDQALTEQAICRTDAQCIWRGVMRAWGTPFDIKF